MLSKIRAIWRSQRNKRKAKKLKAAQAKWDKRFSDQSFSSDKIHKVALLRWDDKLGDAITSTVFISAITKHRPDIEVTILTGKVSAQLFVNIPGNVKVEVLDKRSWDTAKSLSYYKENFDLVIELGSRLGDRDLFALYQLQAPHYLGFDKDDYQIFDQTLPTTHKHFVDRYLAAARLLCPESPLERKFYILKDNTTEHQAEVFFYNLATTGPKVVLNLFGSALHRQFKEIEAKELINWWHEQFPEHQLILLRVPGKDLMLEKLAAETTALLTPTPASLALTMAILRQTDLVFSPDTSVVHFAGALNKPLVTVYNNDQNNFREWAPISDNNSVIFSRSPAFLHEKINVSDFDKSQLKEAICNVLKKSSAKND
ncbi:glycosyltransferase family 9 protein [Gallaecimonas mangrovi]|uniref:glycosyltransferase family 9 protein n=1 Tax=Gallaecimonas mangrovi TaxID=2291597 RepID=UPI000E1FD39A|nr:glycosyltransferase family 9 protein [Gallaecimonas mangrovi]